MDLFQANVPPQLAKLAFFEIFGIKARNFKSLLVCSNSPTDMKNLMSCILMLCWTISFRLCVSLRQF